MLVHQGNSQIAIVKAHGIQFIVKTDHAEIPQCIQYQTKALYSVAQKCPKNITINCYISLNRKNVTIDCYISLNRKNVTIDCYIPERNITSYISSKTCTS